MQVVAALLADQANVREGLVSILSGGLNRLWRDEYPAPLAAVLPVTLELTGHDFGREFTLLVTLRTARGADVASATISGSIERDLDEPDIEGLPGYASLVFGLQSMQIPKPGRYKLELYLDSKLQRTLGFYAGYRRDAPDLRIRSRARSD